MSDKDSHSQDENIPAWQPEQPQTLRISEEESQRLFTEATAKIYPRSVKGRFASWRIFMIFFTQIIYYGLPWLQWNDRQAFLLDLSARKFYIFGLVLWPQDIIYMAIILIVSAYGLFLFTALAGRLFCGYSCPQTVYTEIFMWVDHFVEGDRVQRMRLDESPWNFRKIRIKFTKHLLWILIAIWTGFTFIGYFAPIRELIVQVVHLDLSLAQWFWFIFYGFMTWLMAGVLRENVCKFMCPYARFQSVMVDKDTFVVTYDKVRGDPRGKRSKKVDPKAEGLGDCIDCTICVQVCPTGIDIRNGLQYMCIGCGACVDACDDVMDKMNYPRGLIRYTSEYGMLNRLDNKQVRKRLYRPRIFVYVGLLVLFILGLIISLSMRTPLRVDVVRDRGALGREIPGDLIENVYRIQVINMTDKAEEFKIGVKGDAMQKAKVLLENTDHNTIMIEPFSNKWIPLVIQAPLEDLQRGEIYKIEIYAKTVENASQELEADEESSFYVPN
ncbi:cytochrome c oxidase accessory protein CcoG [Pelistega ratti]|uniref:cytochrome c oxidase accessory protein CcoG n=1 Tax=Pelistega ratti TaxID=2652177 RepID=UPI00135BA206|nr:cytochrome c oxidase accessory protein CcoG [Pelistega ratti]